MRDGRGLPESLFSGGASFGLPADRRLRIRLLSHWRRGNRGDMTQSDGAISIVNVDRLQGSLVVLFSDGTSAMFPNEFLYGARNEKGNEVLPRENLNELPGHE